MMPTPRGLLVILVAAPLMALGEWLPGMEVLGWLYALMAVGLLILDWRWAESVQRFDVARQHDTKLSLGADNPIHILIHNRQPRPARLWVRDEAPESLGIDKRI